MKKLYFLLFAFSLMLFSFTSCTSNGNGNGQIVVNQTQPNIGENLNLQALGEIIRKSSNPEEIEKKINEPDGINNLDLDGDGKIDYLKVTEYGKGSEHGYSICAVLKDGEPEVANVVINTLPNQQAQMSLNGNPNYYGNQNNTYQSTFSSTDFLLLAYLMRPNYGYYHSPYYYGHYGYGYGPRSILSYSAYHSSPHIRTVTTTRTYTTVSRPSSSTLRSPNANNTSSVAAKRVSNFSNASSSQKSFKVNSPSNTPHTATGFGNKPSSSASSSSRSSSSRSSGSGFGSSSRSSSSSRSGRR